MILEAAGSIVLNVTSSFIYDIYKGFKIKKNESEIRKNLSVIMSKYEDVIVSPDGLSQFLKSSKMEILFNNYLLYQYYGIKNPEIFKEISYKKEEFLEELSNLAYTYIENRNGKKEDLGNLKLYFKDLVLSVEKTMIGNLPKEFAIQNYFLSRRMEELEKIIKENLSNKNFVEKTIDYEKNGKTYVQIMKDKYTETFVYGIGTLNLYEYYVFPDFEVTNTSIRETSYEKIVNWKNIFSYGNLISIIGGPGFGKTLFLYNLINKNEELNIYNNLQTIPIYCNLKDYYSFSKEEAYSIEEFLIDSIINNSGVNKRDYDFNFLNYYLESGRCLILLDALDEVPKNRRQELSKKIINFLKNTNKNNKICLTSRDINFIPNTEIVFKVQKITLEKTELYLDNMIKLEKFSKHDKMAFLTQANLLINQGFLTSTLILSLLLNIFKSEKELPENKLELYDKCILFIAKKRERDFKELNFNFSSFNAILDNDNTFEKLAKLAYPNNKEFNFSQIYETLEKEYSHVFVCKNELYNSIKEFVSFCGDRTELVVPSNMDDFFKFYHRSFFEFYYAKMIISNNNTVKQIYTEVRKFDIDSEVFELIISLLKKNSYDKYKKLIEMLIVNIKNNFIEKDFMVLSFFMQIVNEQKYILDYHDIIFNENKNLNKLNFKNKLSHDFKDARIFDIIKGKTNLKDIMWKFFKFYSEEIIIASIIRCYNIYDEMEKDGNRTRNYDFQFVKLSTIYAVLDKKIIEDDECSAILVDFILNYSDDNLVSILNKYHKNGDIVLIKSQNNTIIDNFEDFIIEFRKSFFNILNDIIKSE